MTVPEMQNGFWNPLLLEKQYDQIMANVERAYAAAVAADDMKQVALLAAARQLCASCAQMQKEVSFHQQAYHHSETRQEQLEAELNKLLDMVQIVPETAVLPQLGHFWQRVSHLWRREQPGLPGPAPPAPPNGPGLNGHVAEPLPTDAPAVAPKSTQTSASAIPQLTVYCLGNFCVYEDEHPIDEWPSRKGKAIFKYLLLHRQQRITKEVLMAQFWPEATAEAARNNLNVAIYGLRQALRNGYPEFSHVLFQDDCYFLNPEMEIWVDVEQFELVYQKACRLMQEGDTAVALPDLHAAELLYQGELLAEDRYEDWPTAQRQQLQDNYLQLLTTLCQHYFAAEQYATSITFANKLLQVEPCHEATHRLLMRAYARQRQSYLALRQYHQCVEVLAEELAVPPAPATMQLHEAIRSHQPV